MDSTILRFEAQHGDTTLLLRGLFESKSDADSQLAELTSRGAVAAVLEIQTPKGIPLWGVAARRVVARAAPEYPKELRDAGWQITFRCEQLFRQVEEHTARLGKPLFWYKPFEPHLLRQALDRVDWFAPNIEIASQLLSRSILAHPFPNGNHRTAILMVGTFLVSLGIDWPKRKPGEEAGGMYGTCYPFFAQSKYILQLLQRRRMFQLAIERGFRRFHLGEDRIFNATPEHCLMNDKQLREMHLAEARQLIERLTPRPVRKRLDDKDAGAQHAWLQGLKTLD